MRGNRESTRFKEKTRPTIIYRSHRSDSLWGASSWTAKSYGKIVGANDRIRYALIGPGTGVGVYHLQALGALREKNNLEAMAVVDCWKTRAKKGAESVGAPHAWTDYRRVLDLKDLDYVTISTPERWHAKMAIDVMDANLAVYCEKPLAYSIPDALAIAKKQKETGLPFQVGVQGLSDDSYESAAKAIEEGVLGRVVQAQIEYVRRYGEQGLWRKPEDVQANRSQPADLDWDAWLGSAPKIPWDPHHYFEWRNYSVYSGGIATDLFIHRLTRIMKPCRLSFPRRVVGMGGIWQWPDGRDLPDNLEMICEYPRGMTVYVLGTMSNRVGVDHLIRGYRGTLHFHSEGWIVHDKDGKVLAEHKKTGAEDLHLHHTNLHNHMRHGEPLNCPIDLGVAGVAAVKMAIESWQTGQMMAWDQENQQLIPAHTLPEQNHFPNPDKT